MAQYSRTTTVDSAPAGDSVKQAVLDVDTDLTGIVAAYNAHDTATTDVHGCTGTAQGTGALVRATGATLSGPTLTGTVTLSTATLTGSVTATGLTLNSPAITGGTHTNMTLVTPALGTPASGTLTNCTGLPGSGTTGGLQTIWIPTGAMISRTTTGAALGLVEMSTNKNMFRTLDFDTAQDEFAQFSIQMPKSWDEGTITFAPVWSHAATTTNFGVAWFLQAVAISNDDAGDVAFGTAQSSIDTGGTTNDIYMGPVSSAITIDGTPAANDYVMFQIYRDVSDGGDTLAIDARLHGVQIYYTINTGTDA